MAQNEPPFTPEAIDTQVEDLEAALQFRPSDQSKTPAMQVITALQHIYTAEQQAHNASLQQVRQRLLDKSQTAPARPLHPQETPGKPGEKRAAIPAALRWRGRPLTRLSAIAAALLITVLVGGLIAGLILVRPGNTGASLTGGVEVLLQPTCAAQTQSSCASDALAMLPKDSPILEQRLQDALGHTASAVKLDGSNRIVVDMPPLKQQQDTIGLLSQTGLLEILDTGTIALPVNQPVPPGATYPVVFTGAQLDPASIQTVQDPMSGQSEIIFQFKTSARSAFASYTQKNIGNYLTIALDGIVLESAVIQSQITDQGVIADGSLTLAQTQHIAVLLRSGSLPLPLTVVSVQTIP